MAKDGGRGRTVFIQNTKTSITLNAPKGKKKKAEVQNHFSKSICSTSIYVGLNRPLRDFSQSLKSKSCDYSGIGTWSTKFNGPDMNKHNFLLNHHVLLFILIAFLVCNANIGNKTNKTILFLEQLSSYN